MRLHPESIRAAEDRLVDVEPRFRPLVEAHGPCPLGPPRHRRGHFEALARSIVFQQLAGRAASAIYERVRDAVGGRLTADRVLATPRPELRAAGLSGSKTESLHDLASRVASGSLKLRTIGRLADESVIDRLTVVRGIGRWTAEMFLMFQLGRPDVWPGDDLGVRKGLGLVLGMDAAPSIRSMPELGRPFAPHRSVAAWYCWRAAETIVPD